MNILYVEDDPRDAELTIYAMKKAAPHMNMEVVSTQSDALNLLVKKEATCFDLVLTDMKLPDGDGLAILGHIRARNLPVAVVLVTGGGDEETAVAALKAGADDYLAKRTDYLDRLPDTLESALQRFRAESDRRTHPLHVLYAEDSTSDIDLTLRHFRQYAPNIHLETVSSGEEVMNRLPKTSASKSSKTSEIREVYDVLLLDYRLPGMSALEILKEVRETRRLDLPIVFVTGQGDEDVAIQAIKLGAVDYLVKNPGYLNRLPYVLANASQGIRIQHEQAALRESERKLNEALALGHIGNWEFDVESKTIKWSAQTYALYERGMALGPPTPDEEAAYYTPEQAQIIREYSRRAISEGLEFNYDLQAMLPSGKQIQLSATMRPIKDETGRVIRLFGTIQDITDRKRAEQDLLAHSDQLEEKVAERTRELRDAQQKIVRQEKLAVLGQLAGGVGHELRNPLGVISNAIYYLKMTLPDADEKVKIYLDIIENETRNSEKIITDLLDFARIKSIEPEPLSVTELVQRVLIRFPVPQSVKVAIKLPADLPKVFADLRQVAQVLGNLVTNAWQAMVPPDSIPGVPDGGKLTVSARKREGLVAIAVTDTGVGITPENMTKLFEPLFTTKAKGIGLGLAVSRKLAEANGGHIEVESEPGKGSTFTLVLPIHEEGR